MIRFAATWALLFGTYLLLVDQLVGPELLAGLVSSLLVAAYATHLRRCSKRRHAFPPRPKLHLLTLPRDILTESLGLIALALRKSVPEGTTRTIPFDNETGIDPDQDAGRRALVTVRLSASPNGFVVLRQRDPGRLLMHDLLPPKAQPNADPVWPG